MIFSSLIFIYAFLPVVLGIYYLIPKKATSVRNIWLFLTSLVFYGFGEPKVVFVMLLSIVLNYLLALLVDKYRSKTLGKLFLSLDIIANLLILFIFKYLNFSIRIIDGLYENLIGQTNIALPIGISFFTFQAISYVADVYKEKGKVQKNPLNVGLYIAFFPQLVAGPIVRYETIEKQIKERSISVDSFAEGIRRFLIGFSKKIFIANNVAFLADKIFTTVYHGETVGVVYAWVGALCYSLQIYFDFSGYSDMAIGLGKMFGFEFEENFDNPYAASSVTDFWRRWHISLGSFFRDYVYIPLGGSRVGKFRLIVNLFVVWFLTGLWHGADFNFILWGLMYFVILSFEKLIKIPTYVGKKESSFAVKYLYRVFTLLCIVFGWILFRSNSLGTCFRFVKSMFFIGNGYLLNQSEMYIIKDALLMMIAGILLSFPVFGQNGITVKIMKKSNDRVTRLFTVLETIFLFVLFIIGTADLVVNSYNPFIYFNF